jgi:hypothetical protein
MNYHSKKYSSENLKQRAFILSSFTRNKLTLSVSMYEFADYAITTGWMPELDTLEKVDEQILSEYNKFTNESRRH